MQNDRCQNNDMEILYVIIMNIEPPRYFQTIHVSFPATGHCYSGKDVCKFLLTLCGSLHILGKTT